MQLSLVMAVEKTQRTCPEIKRRGSWNVPPHQTTRNRGCWGEVTSLGARDERGVAVGSPEHRHSPITPMASHHCPIPSTNTRQWPENTLTLSPKAKNCVKLNYAHHNKNLQHSTLFSASQDTVAREHLFAATSHPKHLSDAVWNTS
jgi:hypothetical protein